MTLEERIDAFHLLGSKLKGLSDDEFQSIATTARNENAWFSDQNIRLALGGISSWLDRDLLSGWIGSYTLPEFPKKVAVIMAGNIPLVGFHDLLCVLISGNNLIIRTSSKDRALIHSLVTYLVGIEPRFNERIEFGEMLKGFDAIIATGSDNTSRYFEYYFGKYPNIIRKNRTSIGILNGHETPEQLSALGIDVFSYFGLGCRNISKLFLPEGYRVESIYKHWESFKDIIHHHKYCNNYDYQKSILLVTQSPFLDNGFVMFQQNEKLFSPLAVVYYQYYKDEAALTAELSTVSDRIQCIVGNSGSATVDFGKAQFPSLTDYADRIDTLQFLSQL